MTSLPSRIPGRFPVGRVRLSQAIQSGLRSSRGGLTRPIPLIGPYSGPAPRAGLPIEKARETIRAREGGTLREFLAAKHDPGSLRTTTGPELHQGSAPAELAQPDVQRGSGQVRDAEVARPV